LVVARLTNNTLAFYEKSLVAGNLQSQLTFDFSKAVISLSIGAMDFMVLKDDEF
jgi:hypothetical protein